MTGWLIPSLIYIALLGGLGVTTKLALRHVNWQTVIVWTAVVYAIIAVLLLTVGSGRLFASSASGVGWAALSGILASTALVAFYIALRGGEASRVVPLTSAYPIVTVVLSILVFAESITVLRALAIVLVIGGVVLLSIG